MRERSEQTDQLVSLVLNHAPEVARGQFTVFGCFLRAVAVNDVPCRVCASAYKMYCANAKRRRARAIPATRCVPDPS
jgi:hypothetical protein